LVRLLHYSVCKMCGEYIPYSGRGGVRRICDSCKEKRSAKTYRTLTCVFCGDEFKYDGIGRPKLYCSDECKNENRRLMRLSYMDKYRQKIRNMFF